MKEYTYDLRINAAIVVRARNEELALASATVIMNGMELIDHVRNDTINMDTEDGLDLLEENPILGMHGGR
jgi:hypothetical protein